MAVSNFNCSALVIVYYRRTSFEHSFIVHVTNRDKDDFNKDYIRNLYLSCVFF